MDLSLADLALKYGPATALIIYAASLAVTKFFGAREGVTESGARVDVIDMLTARVRLLEEGQNTYQRQLEDEREKRRAAEDAVATLTRRVSSLEAQLHALGVKPV